MSQNSELQTFDNEAIGHIEEQNRFIEYRAKGWSFRRIAKKLKRSPGTLFTWERDLADRIRELKAVELEEIYQKYLMVKESRISILGDQLLKMREELSRRSFEDVPTDKLLTMILQYQEKLKEEYSDIGTKIGTKMNAQDIAEELHRVLTEYRTGAIDKDRARQEAYILAGMIRAVEFSEVDQKLETLLERLQEAEKEGRW